MAEPIYPGARVTVLGAYCLLMELKRVCRLPFSAMIFILNVLQLLCPAGNLLPTTKYQLLKFAHQSASSHKRIDFCSFCGTELGISKRCSSTACGKGEPNTLIMVSPDQALTKIISGSYSHKSCIGACIVSQLRYSLWLLLY